MTLDDIRRVDPKGMYAWIRDFPKQVEDAVRIGEEAKVRMSIRGIQNIVVTGLGGSAIGGDLLRSYLADDLRLPFVVNRHYVLPEFVSDKTLVIVSSYSGNTEETIAAHKDAIRRKAKVLCISTNGETQRLAKKYGHPIITIPRGLSPRAALGYSFFPLLVTFGKIGLIKARNREIKETIQLLQEKTIIYADPTSPENRPYQLAGRLYGKLPIIYSATEHFDAVNLRWRGQIAENAKQLAFGHVLPEMNHNELVGWKVLTELMKNMHVVFLRDEGTHPRVKIRENITKEVTGQYAAAVDEVRSEGRSLLARIFSLLQFGDWVSLYLAVMNQENPEPVKVIDYLKQELSKVS